GASDVAGLVGFSNAKLSSSKTRWPVRVTAICPVWGVWRTGHRGPAELKAGPIKFNMKLCSIEVQVWSYPFLILIKQIHCSFCSSSTDIQLSAWQLNTHSERILPQLYTYLSDQYSTWCAEHSLSIPRAL
ncbi:hypothetical protein XENOCAPTIV_013442, partial [Xenoophorus captivus]